MNSPPQLASRPGGWPDDSPPRSACFGLSPEGCSGDTFEDVGSYFRRLSAHHGMLPWTFAYRAIAPLIDGRNYESRSRIAEDCYGLAISGMTDLAERWSNALNLLTLRHDLERHTLRPLRGMLSPYKLLCRSERFCPACYAQDEHSKIPKYNRLLWLIDCVTACPVHGLRLKQTPTPKFGDGKAFWLPGFSRVDGSNLANDVAEEASPEEIKFGWLVVDLLEDCQLHHDAFLGSPAIPTFLHHACSSLFGGIAATFAAELGISKGELHGWMTGEVHPSLHRIVLIAYCCNCRVADVVLGNTPPLFWRGRPRNKDCRLINKKRKGALAPESALIANFEQLVASGSVNCVQEAADTLDVSVKFLHKIAPNLTARLVANGKEHQKHAAKANGDAKFKEFLRSHTNLRIKGSYPSRRLVVADVRRRTGITFDFHQACEFQRRANRMAGIVANSRTA